MENVENINNRKNEIKNLCDEAAKIVQDLENYIFKEIRAKYIFIKDYTERTSLKIESIEELSSVAIEDEEYISYAKESLQEIIDNSKKMITAYQNNNAVLISEDGIVTIKNENNTEVIENNTQTFDDYISVNEDNIQTFENNIPTTEDIAQVVENNVPNIEVSSPIFEDNVPNVEVSTQVVENNSEIFNDNQQMLDDLNVDYKETVMPTANIDLGNIVSAMDQMANTQEENVEPEVLNTAFPTIELPKIAK